MIITIDNNEYECKSVSISYRTGDTETIDITLTDDYSLPEIIQEMKTYTNSTIVIENDVYDNVSFTCVVKRYDNEKNGNNIIVTFDDDLSPKDYDGDDGNLESEIEE